MANTLALSATAVILYSLARYSILLLFDYMTMSQNRIRYVMSDTLCMQCVRGLVNNSPSCAWIFPRVFMGRSLVDKLLDIIDGNRMPGKRTCAVIPVSMDDDEEEEQHAVCVFACFKTHTLFLYDPCGVEEDEDHPVLPDLNASVSELSKPSCRDTWTVSPLRGRSFMSYLDLPICELFCAYTVYVVSALQYESVHDALASVLVDNPQDLASHLDFVPHFIGFVANKLGHNNMRSGQPVAVFGPGSMQFPAFVIECSKKSGVASLHVTPEHRHVALGLEGGYTRASPYDGGIRLDGVPTILMARAEFR